MPDQEARAMAQAALDRLEAIARDVAAVRAQAEAATRLATERATVAQVEDIAWRKAVDAAFIAVNQRWDRWARQADKVLDNYLHNRWMQHAKRYLGLQYDDAQEIRKPTTYE